MSYYSHARPEILANVPFNVKRVLDVGCGAGAFGISLKQKLGCEVWGIEPVSEAAGEAKNVLDKVFIGLFEDCITTIDTKFDLICFNDVLEHMPNPWSSLEKTRRLLSDTGIIMASIPNILHYHEFFEILFKRDFRYSEAGIMDKTHLRWFTRKSIIRMFDECGYKTVNIKGLDPTPSKKMTLISLLSFGFFKEMKYPQFLITAAIK
ncbi:MAG: hypothetical protein NVSMB67_09610 [Flavisolibacter sp.]